MYIYIVSRRSLYTLSSEVHGVNTKIRHQTIVSEGRLKEVKNNENSKTENRLPEVSIIKLSGKILVSREVVALGGSIIHVYNTYCTVFLSLSFACWSIKTKARSPM